MKFRSFLWRTALGTGLALGLGAGAIAAPHDSMDSMSHGGSSAGFQRLEQPLPLKIGVTLAGLGLVGLELWWFLLSKPQARRAAATPGVQEMTIEVDGGYSPSRIVVTAGQPVRLNFFRKDPSSCLDSVRFPDFHVAADLPLNKTTPVEFTPDKPGQYQFSCGMNMMRGTIEVQAAES